MKRGIAGLILLVSTGVWAEETSTSPYIDRLKRELEEKARETGVSTSESYTEKIKRQLDASEDKEIRSEKSYTERVKEENPERFQKLEGAPSYTETEKAKLDTVKQGGAIQAVNEGKSDLEMKRPGEIRHAFGIRYGALLTRSITASAAVQARNFNDVYGANYAPDVALFWEIQPFHSEVYGNIGFFFMGGVSYFHGQGLFGTSVSKPGGGTFSTTSDVRFQFFSLPAVAAVNYRMNVLRIFRPYVIFGPSAVGYVEMRNDNRPTTLTGSFGYMLSFGTSLLLDWISGGSTWGLYSDYGVKHFYLSVDYTRFSTIVGNIDYGVQGITAGLTFEY